jgi:hypothetical protein
MHRRISIKFQRRRRRRGGILTIKQPSSNKKKTKLEQDGPSASDTGGGDDDDDGNKKPSAKTTLASDDDDLQLPDASQLQGMQIAPLSARLDDNDEDVRKSGTKNQILLPHMRLQCTVHPYSTIYPQMIGNLRSCNLCFCYILRRAGGRMYQLAPSLSP